MIHGPRDKASVLAVFFWLKLAISESLLNFGLFKQNYTMHFQITMYSQIIIEINNYVYKYIQQLATL